LIQSSFFSFSFSWDSVEVEVTSMTMMTMNLDEHDDDPGTEHEEEEWSEVEEEEVLWKQGDCDGGCSCSGYSSNDHGTRSLDLVGLVGCGRVI
jgi:hypothetical protein